MKDFKRYILFASLLLIIYLVAQFNKPKEIDWSPTFNSYHKIPFGTFILYQRLNDIFPKSEIKSSKHSFYKALTTNNIQGNYVVICNSINVNKYDYEELIKYIKKGNNVFIASSYFGNYFKNKLKIETQSEFNTQELTTLRFLNKNFTQEEFFIDKNSTNSYFSDFDSTKAVILGENNYHHPTFLKFPMGAGSLFVSATPLVFTNYSLLKKPGAEYSSTALSYLNINKDIIWDQFYNKSKEENSSTMWVFLKNEKLKWSFYIVFFGLCIYTLYQMKRRQRIIPVIEPLSNTSVNFAKVVGQVYYEQHNNANIAQKKIIYFLDFIRNKYHLKTNIQDDEFIDILSKKSGVSLLLIKKLFDLINTIQAKQIVDNKELIELNSNIEQFHLESL